MEYLGNIMLPHELQKVAVIFASSAIFWLIDTILRISKGRTTNQRGSVLSIFSEDWEWRNTWLSLIHALTTSVLASIIIYRSEDYIGNLIGPKDAASVLLVCFSLGYFLHDISHIIRGPPRRHSVEFVLHHVLIIPCFGSAIVLERYVGYAIVSLLVEINSVFLHIRRLLLSLTVSRESLIFAINSSLNFTSFLTFRLGTLIWMAWWLYANRDQIPSWLTAIGTVGLSTIIPLNFGLLYHLFNSDYLSKLPRATTN
ncbi:hypothetical protein AAHC03_04454 [Spirometra sp. Aus1]